MKPRTRVLKGKLRRLDADALATSLWDSLEYGLARDRHSASRNDLYLALAHAVRERLIDRWLTTQQAYDALNVRRVHYLSMEYMLGRVLRMNLHSLALEGPCRRVLADVGATLEDLEAQEHDAGLGNGGLGRLAACLLESQATLELPAFGYGIRYQFGIFRQRIEQGAQVEEPDPWLRMGNPWEVARFDESVEIPFYGQVVSHEGGGGRPRHEWTGTANVLAVPYDMPVAGFEVTTVNTLRLWSAQCFARSFDLEDFNRGDYVGAIEDRALAESITSVLYPNDQSVQGKELRLKQQFLLASASLQDVLRRHLRNNPDLSNLADKVSLQLNDTHPTIAIPELMRLLVDVHGQAWEQAWATTTRVFAYTNHTLMPEALERWPVRLLGRLLPRHLQLIYEINHHFLEEVARAFPGDAARRGRMSLIEEGPEQQVRMAYLAIVGSTSVNGVSALHTELLKTGLMRDFHEVFPSRFHNKTNGITPRRWLFGANPRLAELITSRIGRTWLRDLDALRWLRPLAEDAAFRAAWREAKAHNKRDLAARIEALVSVRCSSDSIFDVQIKRIHLYKRQLLLLLHAAHRYLEARRDPSKARPPRTFVLAGKAAPGYFKAKLVIRLVHAMASVVNADPASRDRIVFLPDYGVSLAEAIIPAADVSEQISVAGKEASGTGNMKLSLNGALTVCTLDGANIEIREAVGAENVFSFGLLAHEVAALRDGYRPYDLYQASPALRAVLDAIAGGAFSPEQPGTFQPLVSHLLERDEFMVLADFAAYLDCQARVDAAYADPERWTRMAILNVAGMGRFSSDRTVTEYARDVWRLEPLPLSLNPRV